VNIELSCINYRSQKYYKDIFRLSNPKDTQSHLCTSLHLWTALFCIYGLRYYCCCCTVCTALLFSYSAIFIAASVQNKLTHSTIQQRSQIEIPSNILKQASS